jgi:AraC family transcriptional regulator of arabinose operon
LDIELLICGFSYHKDRFYTQEKSGLPAYLFRLQTEGKAHAWADGELRLLEPGDLLLYKPGDPYELVIDHLQISPEYPIISGDYFLMCRGAWMDHWWFQSPKPMLSRILLDDRILSLWRQLSLEKRRLDAVDHELIGYLLRSLCIYLDRACVEAHVQQGNNYTALQMKKCIEEKVMTSFKIEDIAQSVGLSVSRAVHLYKACFGTSMLHYAIEIRLSVSKERMHYSTLNLEQIAHQCGFHSYPHFHRLFKLKYGVSPYAYRSIANKVSLTPYDSQ